MYVRSYINVNYCVTIAIPHGSMHHKSLFQSLKLQSNIKFQPFTKTKFTRTKCPDKVITNTKISIDVRLKFHNV